MLIGKCTTLRPLERSDLSTLVAWLNDPHIRLRTAQNRPASLSEQERWFDRMLGSQQEQVFVIEHDQASIGVIGLHEIHWRNRNCTTSVAIGGASQRGRGYGTDALETLTRYAHSELGLVRVELSVFVDNACAIRSYEKAGYVAEGTRRAAVWRSGAFADLLLMSHLQTDERTPRTRPTK